jgi:hypothetical protein
MSSRMNNVPPVARVDRLVRVLAGALHVWGVAGTVAVDARDPCAVLVDSDGAHFAVRHDPAAGWTIALRDPGSGALTPLERYAGLPGLLRGLRAELAPEAPAGRLVIAQ